MKVKITNIKGCPSEMIADFKKCGITRNAKRAEIMFHEVIGETAVEIILELSEIQDILKHIGKMI